MFIYQGNHKLKFNSVKKINFLILGQMINIFVSDSERGKYFLKYSNIIMNESIEAISKVKLQNDSTHHILIKYQKKFDLMRQIQVR